MRVLVTVLGALVTAVTGAIVAAALIQTHVGGDPSPEWWIVTPLVPVLYAVVVWAWAPRGSVLSRVGATVGLAAAHATLWCATAAVLDVLGAMPFATALRAASRAAPPTLLVQVLAVLLLARPIRLLLDAEPKPRARARYPMSRPTEPPRPRESEPRRTLAKPLAPPRQDESSPRATEPARPRAETPPAPGPPAAAAEDADALRVPFARIVEQLPADAFTAPLERVAERLREPGMLLVPRRVVLLQLGEGIVTVPWKSVEPQFPAELFVEGNGALASRIAQSRLVLPLDELIRQLPADVFLLPDRTDAPGLEALPLPFQPRAGDDPSNGIEAAAPPADDAPPAAVDTVEPNAIAPSVPPPSPVEPQEAEPAVTTEPAAATVPEEIVEVFARVNGLEIDAQREGDVTVFRAAKGGGSKDALGTIARRLLPVLDAGWAGHPLDQLTLCRRADAVVVTPLPSSGGNRPVFVIATQRAGSFALLELLSRQVATAYRNGDGASVSAAPEAAHADDPSDLGPTAGPDLARVVAILGAFGAARAASYRDTSAGLTLHVIADLVAVPAHVARFAARVARALQGGDTGCWESITCRAAGQQVALRRLASRGNGARLLVVAGRLDRQGLGELQMRQAATAVEAMVG